MEQVWIVAALWLLLALIAVLVAWSVLAIAERVAPRFRRRSQDSAVETPSQLALFGLNHGIIDQGQYSQLVATVIGSAVIPTAIANARFMPRHLLPKKKGELQAPAYEEPIGGIES